MTRLADLRQEYASHVLDAEHAADDPIDQFKQWFQEALEAGVPEPNAMTLATATPEGQPSARIVLLKDVGAKGFVFYSNYESRKGKELARNPQAALVFWWEPLERQVRIEGTVERIPEEESNAYFQRRPRGSQLGAWASPQSRVIESRDVLKKRLAEVKEEYGDGDPIPRPPQWGGFRLQPTAIEFWQGRPNRLHDRLHYRRNKDRWTLERLAP